MTSIEKERDLLFLPDEGESAWFDKDRLVDDTYKRFMLSSLEFEAPCPNIQSQFDVRHRHSRVQTRFDMRTLGRCRTRYRYAS